MQKEKHPHTKGIARLKLPSSYSRRKFSKVDMFLDSKTSPLFYKFEENFSTSLAAVIGDSDSLSVPFV